MFMIIYLYLGMSGVGDCRQCLGGFYCWKPGADDFDASRNDTGTGICSERYYCKMGENMLNPVMPFELPKLPHCYTL